MIGEQWGKEKKLQVIKSLSHLEFLMTSVQSGWGNCIIFSSRIFSVQKLEIITTNELERLMAGCQ